MGVLETEAVQELIEVINEYSTQQDASADLLANAFAFAFADARAQRVKRQAQNYARTKVLVV